MIFDSGMREWYPAAGVESAGLHYIERYTEVLDCRTGEEPI